MDHFQEINGPCSGGGSFDKWTILPEHLIIRNVESVFNENEIDNNYSSQEYFENRLDYCLKQLLTTLNRHNTESGIS